MANAMPVYLVTYDPFRKVRDAVYSFVREVAADQKPPSAKNLHSSIHYFHQRNFNSTLAGHHRSEFIDDLRSLVGVAAGAKQRDFWSFLNCIWTDKEQIDQYGWFGGFIFENSTGDFITVKRRIFHKQGQEPPKIVWGASARSKLSLVGHDNQDWLAARGNNQSYLSRRGIRAVLNTAFQAIEEHESARSVNAILNLFREVFIAKIFSHIRRRLSDTSSRQFDEASTARDRILSFALHTGISPPSPSKKCSGAGWAPVSLVTEAQEVSYEKIRGRKHRGNLLDAVFTKYPRPRCDQGAQNSAAACGRREPKRRQCAWRYSALAQCTGPLRFESARQMASYLPVVQRKFGRVSNSTRTSLEGRQ